MDKIKADLKRAEIISKVVSKMWNEEKEREDATKKMYAPRKKSFPKKYPWVFWISVTIAGSLIAAILLKMLQL